jgi:glycosyltransferase involved in cell wall biosynthesis
VKRDITICIPSIPPRSRFLERAIASVTAQSLPVEAVAVAIDNTKAGAWATRNRALEMATTTWVGFLDDDDELLPIHCERLMQYAEDMDLDMVWGWFEVIGGGDPFPHYRGRQYDINQPHIVPITYIAKRELLMDGPRFQADEIGAWDNQDQPVIDHIVNSGGKLFGASDTTWLWHHHCANTSGMPRW